MVDVILLMAGISPNIMLWVGPFTTFHSAFVHANLNWTLGPFKYVLATPVFHRWHHTSLEEGGNTNFAGTFPLWDIMFGTFRMPENKRADNYGVDDQSVPPRSADSWPIRSASRTSAWSMRPLQKTLLLLCAMCLAAQAGGNLIKYFHELSDGSRFGGDFIGFWNAAHRVRHGDFAAIYDPDTWQRILSTTTGPVTIFMVRVSAIHAVRPVAAGECDIQRGGRGLVARSAAPVFCPGRFAGEALRARHRHQSCRRVWRVANAGLRRADRVLAALCQRQSVQRANWHDYRGVLSGGGIFLADASSAGWSLHRPVGDQAANGAVDAIRADGIRSVAESSRQQRQPCSR
jgi:hypothetical protein